MNDMASYGKVKRSGTEYRSDFVGRELIFMYYIIDNESDAEDKIK